MWPITQSKFEKIQTRIAGLERSLKESRGILERITARSGVLPIHKWSTHDQKALHLFIQSQQGQKMFSIAQAKLFAQHIEACKSESEVEGQNAYLRGWNDLLSFLLYLSMEDSISGSSPVKEQTTQTDQRESASEPRRAY